MKTSSFQEDLHKFQEILTRSAELEKDIPPRSVYDCQKRARGAKRKLKLKNGKIPRPKYGGPRIKGETVKQTVKEKKNHGKKVTKRSSSELNRGTGVRTRSKSKKGEKVDDSETHKKIESDLRLKMAKQFPSKSLRERAVTFEDKVVTQNLYSALVEKIRDASDDIDFGMLWRLVPKNIAVERASFSVENKEADKLLWTTQAAAFSDDIDLFFRQISGWPLENSQSLPLV